MRRLSLLVVVAVAALAMGITREQSLVSGVLTTLKFESVKAEGGLIGGPQKFKITKESIDYLAKLLEDGNTLVIENNGSVKIEGAQGKPVAD